MSLLITMNALFVPFLWCKMCLSFYMYAESQILHVICVNVCFYESLESKGVSRRGREFPNVDHKWSYCVCASSRTQNTKRNEHAWKRTQNMDRTLYCLLLKFCSNGKRTSIHWGSIWNCSIETFIYYCNNHITITDLLY